MNETETVRRLLEWTSQRPRDQSTKHLRVTRMLDRFCPGLERREIVKVAGTNGKGSVCAFVEAGLLAGSRTVGLFTSPHLERVTERIRVNSREVSADDLEAHVRDLAPQLFAFAEEYGAGFIPSFFEVMMLIASRMFIDHEVDYAVFEAGIGGASDATSMLNGRVAALSSVSLDHEDRLGFTVSVIAKEKSGIATRGSTLVVGPGVDESVLAVIRKSVASRGVRVLPAGFRVGDDSADTLRQQPLPAYQLDNAATAAAVLDCLSEDGGASFSQSLHGMRPGMFPGRFEYVPGSPAWLLDGAHNEEALAALAAAVAKNFPSVERVLIYGASAGRSLGRYVTKLPQLAKTIHVSDDFHNALDRNVLAGQLPVTMDVRVCSHDIGSLVRRIKDDGLMRNALVIVTGSLFLVGRARTALGLSTAANA